MSRRLAGALLALWCASAHAETVLRIGTVAPDGTAWAREIKAFARDVAAQTSGALTIKWIMGGIAGDDVQVHERIQRGQLDGVASAGMLCQRFSPTMRVLHLMSTTREEAAWLTNRMRAVLDEDFAKQGYALIGTGGIGPDVFFTREAPRTMADLRKARLWVWDLDDVVRLQLPQIGGQPVPLPMNDARRAYEESRTDGFVAVPSAALAYQWSAATRYVTDLRLGYLTACVLIAARAMDALPNEQREIVRSAAAKLQLRFEDVSRQTDEALLGGLFARQGLTANVPSASFRNEFQTAVRSAREKLVDKLGTRALMDRAAALIEEYRRTHTGSER